MRKVKCGIPSIVYLKGDRIKIAPVGCSLPYPSEVALTDEDLAEEQTQVALQKGWIVFVEEPVPAAPVMETCQHGFTVDQKCDYCAADKDVPAGVPAILEQLEAQDTVPADEPAAPAEEVVPSNPEVVDESVSKRGRKKKNV